MRLTANNIALLDADKDSLLCKYIEQSGKLCYDPAVEIHYLPHIRRGDVVIDAGAAVGDHTIAYIGKTGSADLVHAFECNPLMVECLRHNCPGCHIHTEALSDQNGVAYFHPNSENAGGSYLMERPGTDAIAVETRTLDSYGFDRVNFIKLDLEGYEQRAICGGLETLRRCRPILMIEVIPPQLRRGGYEVEHLFTVLKCLEYNWRPVIGDEKMADNYFELLCTPR